MKIDQQPATEQPAAGQPAPRTSEQRKKDVLARLEQESDIWVATADEDGVPCLVPLWFRWDGEALWLATRTSNPTGRNLERLGRTRLAFGHTRDVVLIDGTVESFSAEAVPVDAADAFAARWGWDPRTSAGSAKPYAYYRVVPRAVQAWHEQHEQPGRHLMREGVWVV
ncbi:pyridoxamine 5'-phosphate oxidase family protein [Streptomyces sp. NBC_00237]|uniref:pyridoxamine 5'-phosphate oxidase family protein n=1 Tax=Streptomyces sp. NBC_00237 TaxID=2975687 RepID=UPI00225A8F3D|nr:pyridoxamine 5'-phosphate oxidase family protein [Streptomyces sp. NBC_00237]MCX5206541.1 pyridoxamine 5'-phosphate oxidase family protein [Streptomyces sp. NBC_00237]